VGVPMFVVQLKMKPTSVSMVLAVVFEQGAVA
jgi:hypothetical protein